MSNARTNKYAERLSQLIQIPTVSEENQTDLTDIYRFHTALREMFPHIFAACELEDFDGSILLRWKGSGDGEPILLMNHMDVVEAPGVWTHPPFAGEIADGKIWGRGTLDTKGGLCPPPQAQC